MVATAGWTEPRQVQVRRTRSKSKKAGRLLDFQNVGKFLNSDNESPRLRILIGPFLGQGTSDYMVGAFDDFDTLTFGNWAQADIQVSGLPSLTQILGALPSGWEPNLIILWRPEYGYIPTGFENAPCPTAMLISDWYLAFSDCLEAAWRVDAVVTGTRGYRIFSAAGFDHIIAMPMLGYQPEIDGQFSLTDDQRDIDVFCGGNPHFLIHQQRAKIVSDLLDLPPDISLYHGPFVSRREYGRLLGRSKIFINQTVIGEINMKVYEVPAAGACLFVEEENLDIRDYLTPDESVVLFNRHNLQDKIRYFLEHEDERAEIARRSRSAMAGLTYRRNFREIVHRLRDDLGKDEESRPRPIAELSSADQSEGMIGYALRHDGGDALAPITLFRNAKMGDTARAVLLGASAMYKAKVGGANPGAQPSDWQDQEIIARFRKAHECDPQYLPAAYAWSRIATIHLQPSVAFPLIDRVKQLLASGCPIPFSCADYFPWGTQIRFILERTAWEALEKGNSLEEALRPIMIEDVLVMEAQLATTIGDLRRAEAALERAISIRPRGFLARPPLATALIQAGEWDRAADVWRAHLAVHPMDLAGYEGLLSVGEQSGSTVISAAELSRLERIKGVFDI